MEVENILDLPGARLTYYFLSVRNFSNSVLATVDSFFWPGWRLHSGAMFLTFHAITTKVMFISKMLFSFHYTNWSQMTVACIQETGTFDCFCLSTHHTNNQRTSLMWVIIAWLVKFVLLINLQYLIVLGYKNFYYSNGLIVCLTVQAHCW